MTTLNHYATRLGGKAYAGNYILCPGPGHSRDDRSLKVNFKPDGSFTTTSFAGDDFRECRDHVKAVLGLDDREPQPLPSAPVRLLDKAAQIERARRIWIEAKPIECTSASTYLLSRGGIVYNGEALRFHPNCPFRSERHPAMVGLITDIATGEPCGIHRTALLADGSGKAAPGKMMMGRAQSAVVRLHDDADVSSRLCVSEGIETALATADRPIWACLSAGTMKSFPVLPGVESITIYADHDKAGIEAANDCGSRWFAADREVTQIMPSTLGFDMAEVA